MKSTLESTQQQIYKQFQGVIASFQIFFLIYLEIESKTIMALVSLSELTIVRPNLNQLPWYNHWTNIKKKTSVNEALHFWFLKKPYYGRSNEVTKETVWLIQQSWMYIPNT